MQDAVEAKRSVLAALLNQLPGNATVIRLAKSLAKSFKPTVASSLERASHLAYWLYVYDQPALSLQVCQLLNDLAFSNDYNKWTWVESTLALEWKLRTILGQSAEAQACVTAIRATYAVGDAQLLRVKDDALRYRMRGGLMRDAQLADAEQAGDASLVNAYRLYQVGQLVFIEALGGSAEMPTAEIEQRLEQLRSRLRAG